MGGCTSLNLNETPQEKIGSVGSGSILCFGQLGLQALGAVNKGSRRCYLPPAPANRYVFRVLV